MYWIIGETFGTAEIALDACHAQIMRVMSGRLIKRYSRSDHRIELVGGGVIEGKSADHPEGMLGRGLHGAIFEEAPATQSRIWYQYVQPALADHHGWALFVGSPRGRGNWFYELREESKGDPAWSFRCSPSWENGTVFPGGPSDPWLVAARERYARAGMLALYEQEYGGSFAHLQGRVWAAWDPERHIRPLDECRAGVAEWRIACDWGLRTTAMLVVGRTESGGYRVVDEVYRHGMLPDERRAEALRLAKQYGIRRGWGDPADPTSNEMLNEAGLAVSPAFNDVDAGILAVAGKFGEDDGIKIAAGACPNLCREVENWTWRESTSAREIQEPVKKDDHACDALRYGVASWERLFGEQQVVPTRVQYGGGQRGRVYRGTALRSRSY